MPQGCGASQTLKKKNEVETGEEFSASLFEEEDTEPEKLAPQHWQDLVEAEQQPFVDQARAEMIAIHAGSGIAPRPKLVEVRAINLYDQVQKGGGE